jgi:alpha-L-fucosidase
MKKAQLLAEAFLLIIFQPLIVACAQPIGGGDLNPNLSTNSEAIAKWRDARVGFTVHWGPVSLRGTEMSWSRSVFNIHDGNDKVGKKDYDSLYKDFNPALFNARDWVTLIKDSGFRYVTLVTKHHDGFSMWDTKQSDYNIMHTPFHRDWLKEMSEECRRQGIIFGTYYSIRDWYQYDFTPHSAAGPGFTEDRPPDYNRYLAFMKNQLKELVQDYGSEIISLDGPDDPTWTHERGGDLYKFLRTVKDNIVISSRVENCFEKGEGEIRANPLWVFYNGPWDHEKCAGDYYERENNVAATPYPWEAWVTLGEQWSWKANDKYKSADEIIRYIIVTAGGNGNFNLDVTPMPDGRFEQRQKDILLKIGAWLKTNGETIYGTRGGPFEPGLWGASTRRENKIYVHVVSWPSAPLRLPPLKEHIQSARCLNGAEVEWKQSESGLEISVPTKQRDALDTIVELTKVD